MSVQIKKPIHILHVVPGFEPGGMETVAAHVIARTQGSEFRHSLICLTGEALLADRLPRDVKVFCMHARPNEAALPLRLARLMREIKPTLVQAYNWGAWPDTAAACLLHRPPAGLLFAFHGFMGDPPLRKRLAFRLLPMVTRHMVTVSHATGTMLQREFGWAARRMDVIPNGIDVNRFRLASGSAAGQPLVIGNVASLTPIKNQAMLLGACARLVRRGLDIRVRIAGQGPLRRELEQLSRSLGLEDRVQFEGQVKDIPAFLSQLDIFALTSLSECHPNALLEAMASGLPCVATAVGGMPEALDHGRCGLIVKRGDEAGLAEALQRLINDAGLRESLAAAARRKVERDYTLRRMVKCYIALYRRLARSDKQVSSEILPQLIGRPRVLMLGPAAPLTGGMASVVDNLASSSLSTSCELEVLNTGKLTPARRSFWAGAWRQLTLMGSIARAILSRRTQLVHIHTCASFTFMRDSLHMLVSRAMGCKVVWHIHDGTFEAFSKSRLRCIVRSSLELASAVAVLSHTARSQLGSLSRRVRWHLAPNGVQVHPAGRRSRGCTRFLFLGELTARKGAHDLLQAAAGILSSGLKCKIQLAGPVTPDVTTQLLSLVAPENRKDIELLGIIRGPEKLQLLSNAHCIVLPSYAEALPMAILEGMAHGLPAIGTDVGAVAEVIRDGVEGFVVQPGYIYALRERMLRIIQDKPLRIKMGRAAKRRIIESYSIEAAARAVMQIYASVLGVWPRRYDQSGSSSWSPRIRKSASTGAELAA